MFALEVPTQPAVSGSRSLTTLLRDLNAEFADLDDLLHDDSLASSFVEFDDLPADDSLDGISTASLLQSASLLDELELVASTVKALPVPRPPSLSVAEWENALDSPDPRFSSHFFPGEETIEELSSIAEIKTEMADRL